MNLWKQNHEVSDFWLYSFYLFNIERPFSLVYTNVFQFGCDRIYRAYLVTFGYVPETNQYWLHWAMRVKFLGQGLLWGLLMGFEPTPDRQSIDYWVQQTTHRVSANISNLRTERNKWLINYCYAHVSFPIQCFYIK